MTVREAEYSPADLQQLLHDREDERQPRNAVGIPLILATDPAYQYAWEVGLPTTDFVMARLSAARAAYKKQYPEADMGSLLWGVTREPDPPET